MTRPCGCTSDPVVFGHSHPGDPIPAIMAAIWGAATETTP